MKTKTLILVVFFVFLFFVAGCTLRKPVNYGCCVVDESASSPSCLRLKDSSPSLVSLVSTNLCEIDRGLCNVTLRLTFSNDPIRAIQETAVVPICTNTTSQCLPGDCIAQVCGPFRYEPRPTPSYTDTSRASSSSPSLVSDASYAFGLYNKTCRLVDAGATLDNFFTNTKGSFVNTFRFGLGSSFAQFDEYRYLFPISDFYCNVNPNEDAKDRYMNYMMSPLEFQDFRRDRLTTKPQDRALVYNFCPRYDQSPFFSTTYSNSPFPNYKRSFVRRDRYNLAYSEVYIPLSRDSLSISWSYQQNLSITRINPFNYTKLDKRFYAGTLPLIYFSQLESYDSISREASFECSSPTQCMSGLCNFADYRRSICKSGSSWVLCGCDKNARKCFGEATILNTTVTSHVPYTAADIETYFRAYQNSGTLYKSTVPFNVTVHLARIDPHCNEGVVTRIDAEPSDCASSPGETCFNYASEQVPDSPIFPSNIQFFGEVREGYIGYSLLRREDFEKTDFAVKCGLENGRDYDVAWADGPPPIEPTDLTSEQVTAVTSTGAIYSLPAPIPERVGHELRQRPTCAAVGDEGHDEVGKYSYVLSAIRIRSTGRCDLDPTTKMPITKTFGWCEGCSFSNIAKQVVTSSEPSYIPLVERESPSLGSSFNYSLPTCNFARFPLSASELLGYAPYVANNITGISSQPLSSGAIPYGITCPGYEGPPLVPTGNFTATSVDSLYLTQKQAEFFREGTLPVLDISDFSNWDSQGNLIINSSIIDRGPAILIVSKLTSYPNPATLGNVANRLLSTKTACTQCLTSVQISPIFMNAVDVNTRYLADLIITDSLNRSTRLFDNLDVISYSYYPAELVRAHPTFCSMAPTIRNELLLNSVANFSKTFLRRYAPKYKPSLIADFYFTPTCLDNQNISLAVNYLVKNQKTLSRNGLLGLIYTGLPSDLVEPSSPYSSDLFCAINKGAKNMLSSEPMTIYTKVPTVAVGNATCQICTDADLVLGRCNPVCDNGVRCQNPLDSVLNEEASRRGTTRDQVIANFLRCPMNTVPEPCAPCSARTESMLCDFFLSDGSSYSQTFALRDLSAATADLISSIPAPYKCCISDPGRPTNYTFFKQTTVDHTVAPIVFSRGGDPRQDCGIADLSLLTPQMCGADAPFRNYRVKCRVI